MIGERWNERQRTGKDGAARAHERILASAHDFRQVLTIE
jgi:hypothetical protein